MVEIVEQIIEWANEELNIRDRPLENLSGGGGGGRSTKEKYSRKGKLNEREFIQAN